MLVLAITANFWQVVTFDMTLTHFSTILSAAVSYPINYTGTPQQWIFSSRLNRVLLRGFPLIRGFYVVKNPLVKPTLSINEGVSTIEGSTNEGFQCTY